MTVYYDELFGLCGFQDKEIEKEKVRIEKVFEKIDIGPDDMDRTVKRVNEQFDIQLLGVRKLLRAWLLELLDLSLAKEEKKKWCIMDIPVFKVPVWP